MQSPKGAPEQQWHSHYTREGLEGITFAYFKNYLRNLVGDPKNRRLMAYERWCQATQGSYQKVVNFKSYLEGLEEELEDMTQQQKAYFFLAKLQRELKDAILRSANVPDNREELLAIATQQEQVLDRGRRSGATSTPHRQSKPSSQG